MLWKRTIPIANVDAKLATIVPFASALNFPSLNWSLAFPASLPMLPISARICTTVANWNWGSERVHDAFAGVPELDLAPRGQLRHRQSGGSTKVMAATLGLRTSHRPAVRCFTTRGFRTRPEQDATGGGVVGKSPRLSPSRMSANVPALDEHSVDMGAHVEM